MARPGTIHQGPCRPIRQRPPRADLGPLQRAGQFGNGREELAAGRRSVSLGARGETQSAADHRRLDQLRRPHVESPDGDVRRGVVPRIRRRRGSHRQEPDLPRVQPARLVHGMAASSVGQHVRDDPPDFRPRPDWQLPLGPGGRPDANVHAVGFETGRPHAKDLAARRVSRGRHAVRRQGIRAVASSIARASSRKIGNHEFPQLDRRRVMLGHVPRHERCGTERSTVGVQRLEGPRLEERAGATARRAGDRRPSDPVHLGRKGVLLGQSGINRQNVARHGPRFGRRLDELRRRQALAGTARLGQRPTMAWAA